MSTLTIDNSSSKSPTVSRVNPWYLSVSLFLEICHQQNCRRCIRNAVGKEVSLRSCGVFAFWLQLFSLSLSLSSVLTAIFQVYLGQPVFIEAKDDGGGGDSWTTGAVSRAKLQSNPLTNKLTSSFFTGRMPFLSPNQQCQSTKGKISHSMDLLTPSSSGGLPTLSLTTNSSWLPWGGYHASHQPFDASIPQFYYSQ